VITVEPNFTSLTEVKPVPEMTTVLPGAPVPGETPVTVGGAR
jgi:hypothetical protein